MAGVPSHIRVYVRVVRQRIKGVLEMRFSIIIPAFNAEKTIQRCIDSALRQHEAEVIVVDDGSTDRTADIAEAYMSTRVHRLIPNRGPGIARNRGLEAAQGRWVIFLDADDELMPGALKRLAEFIDAQPVDLDLVGFNWIGDGDQDGMRRDGHWLNGSSADLLNAYVSLRMDGAVTFTAFRSDVLKNIRFRAGYHEDVDFLYLAYQRAQYAMYFDNICYIKHGNGITGTVTEKHIDGFIEAWRHVIDSHYTQTITPEMECGIIGVVATRVREIVLKVPNALTRSKLLGYLHGKLPMVWQEVCLHSELQTPYAKIAREFIEHGKVNTELFDLISEYVDE